MSEKINLKKVVDTEFFELPKNRQKSWWLSFKLNMSTYKISPDEPLIIVSNKTSPYDKQFLTSNIGTPFVFLRDEILGQLYSKQKSENIETIKNKISELLNLGISIVVFPEKHMTIFGDYAKIPECVTTFLKNFQRKIIFFSLIGTYFIKPIWSVQENVCQTKIEQRFELSKNMAKSLDAKEYNERFNGYMPSSASTYIYRYGLFLRGKKPAENLETIIYVCPNCNKLLSLYSEFGCVKCADCGTAFEFGSTGEINLTKKFSNLDEAKAYQKNVLSRFDFKEKIIVKYSGVKFCLSEMTDKQFQKQSQDAEFCIYKNKTTIKNETVSESISFDKISDIWLERDNTLKIETKQDKKFTIKGDKKENFYIIFDLIDINKSKE